jgi:hypothetical protein
MLGIAQNHISIQDAKASEQDSSDDEAMKMFFNEQIISAKDIVLTPFSDKPEPRNLVFSRLANKLN